MPAHWSIEDGQVIPLATFTGDDHPHPSGIAFTTNPTDASIPGCVYNTTPPTLANGQQSALQCDVNGKLRVTTS